MTAPVLIEVVRVDQAWAVVIGGLQDGRQEGVLVRHGGFALLLRLQPENISGRGGFDPRRPSCYSSRATTMWSNSRGPPMPADEHGEVILGAEAPYFCFSAT